MLAAHVRLRVLVYNCMHKLVQLVLFCVLAILKHPQLLAVMADPQHIHR